MTERDLSIDFAVVGHQHAHGMRNRTGVRQGERFRLPWHDCFDLTSVLIPGEHQKLVVFHGARIDREILRLVWGIYPMGCPCAGARPYRAAVSLSPGKIRRLRRVPGHGVTLVGDVIRLVAGVNMVVVTAESGD